MSVAYCILAHKNPAQVARLLRAIWERENLYVLHYEKRAPQGEHEAVVQLAREYENVRVLAPQAILWGRFSQVAVQLEALALALRSHVPWTHFINLTGQDLPLKPPSAISEELSAAPGTSWVSFFDPNDGNHWNNAGERLTRIHLDSPLLEAALTIPGIGRQVRRLLGWTNRMPFVPWIRRKAPAGFKYVGGSNHLILSRAAASYLVSDRTAQETIRWLKWSLHPDETVFQSVLLNSPLRGSIVNDDRRAIYWMNTYDPSPRTLLLTDLERLKGARKAGKLFARKFDIAVDEEVVLAIENDLAMPVRKDSKFPVDDRISGYVTPAHPNRNE